MKTIVVKTQKDLDKLPEKFEECTQINIESNGAWIVIRKAWENSNVVARGNSNVVARWLTSMRGLTLATHIK